RGYPAYTDNRVNVNAICRNYQVNPRTAIRNAKFFVEGTTGIPANHRATTAGDGTNMTLERLYGLSWLQNATYFDYNAAGNLSTNDPRGVNSTFAVQCQDSNTPFNYWGPFEKDWLVTDTKAPITGSGFDFASDNLEFGENYTNTPEHNLTVKFGVLPRYNPDLVRFSCQRDGPWTNWRFYNYTQESQTYRFDLTSPLNGCQPTDRNVTVHAQIRDFANNTASQLATDWIVLDRNDPSATSLEPQNRYINLTDLIRINGTDDRALSVGLEAPNNTFSTDALYDGFEDGNDDKWTAQYDCGWGVQTQHAIGQYSVEMGDGNSYIVRSLDISDLQDVKVTYYGDTSSMDSSGENGYAEWWDGVSWHTLVTHHNDPFGKHVADIPSSWIDQGGNNKIRFRLDGSDCGDHFYVDEIAVQNQVNGTFIANVSFNPGYNYSFAESGSTQLTSWLYDRASNLALNTFDLFVDVRSPAVDQITTNASYIRPEKNISINVSDDQSFGFMRLNNGTETTQFTSTSVSYEPGWTQEIWKNLTLRMNDSAGNPTVRRYWYYIDGTPPTLDTISDSNTSYINDSILTVTASDARAGLG
ncbi:MAG: hypothetical protein SV186_05295, partial [Candidatus Nanohaloarchaea archaeon]|nr:hypothetical protein [Candidatus Nanohaloarchaea archaeon]